MPILGITLIPRRNATHKLLCSRVKPGTKKDYLRKGDVQAVNRNFNEEEWVEERKSYMPVFEQSAYWAVIKAGIL